MTTWDDTYHAATLAFGSAPRAELETRLLDAYTNHPRHVTDMLERTIDDHARGTIRSPWGIISRRLDDLQRIPAGPHESTTDREQAASRAEQWIRTAGLHYDRWSEVEDDLYGDRGRLRQWADDQTLRTRMHSLWTDQRPRGEQVDTEAEKRAARYILTRDNPARQRTAPPRQPAPEEATA